MKREELEAFGLSKEQIDKVLNKYHEEYDPVKKDLEAAQEDLKNEQAKGCGRQRDEKEDRGSGG